MLDPDNNPRVVLASSRFRLLSNAGHYCLACTTRTSQYRLHIISSHYAYAAIRSLPRALISLLLLSEQFRQSQHRGLRHPLGSSSPRNRSTLSILSIAKRKVRSLPDQSSFSVGIDSHLVEILKILLLDVSVDHDPVWRSQVPICIISNIVNTYVCPLSNSCPACIETADEESKRTV